MNKLYEQIEEPFTIISNYVIESDILTPKEKLVYLCLKKFADYDSGQCFPSIKKIAAVSGYSRVTVIEAIKGLEEKKFLKKEHRVSENNHGDMSNMYKLYPRPYEDTDTKCTETYIQSSDNDTRFNTCEQKKDFPHHRKIPYENNGVNKTTV